MTNKPQSRHLAKLNTPTSNLKAKGMDNDLIKTYQKITRIFRRLDHIHYNCNFCLCLTTGFVFDAFETLLEFLRKHEIVEFDQLIITLLVVLSFAFSILTFLRLKELKHEIIKHKQGQAALTRTEERGLRC